MYAQFDQLTIRRRPKLLSAFHSSQNPDGYAHGFEFVAAQSGRPGIRREQVGIRIVHQKSDQISKAAKLGVEVVATFSGCPGGAPGDMQPNWVTYPWPPEYLDILDYQWKDVVIPYWQKTTALAREHGIHIVDRARR